MAQKKVFYPEPVQHEMTTGLVEIYEVTAGRTKLQVTMLVCNFSGTDRGYDLKARPKDDATGNLHYWRGSKAAGVGKGPIEAGHTEIWRLHVRPFAAWVIEVAAEAANAISITISAAEMENES